MCDSIRCTNSKCAFKSSTNLYRLESESMHAYHTNPQKSGENLVKCKNTKSHQNSLDKTDEETK